MEHKDETTDGVAEATEQKTITMVGNKEIVNFKKGAIVVWKSCKQRKICRLCEFEEVTGKKACAMNPRFRFPKEGPFLIVEVFVWGGEDTSMQFFGHVIEQVVRIVEVSQKENYDKYGSAPFMGTDDKGNPKEKRVPFYDLSSVYLDLFQPSPPALEDVTVKEEKRKTKLEIRKEKKEERERKKKEREEKKNKGKEQ